MKSLRLLSNHSLLLQKAWALTAWTLLTFATLLSRDAQAASFEGSLRNLITSITTVILPTISVGYIAWNGFEYIRGNPDARNNTQRILIGVICLLGVNGVWSWLKAQIQ